MLASNGLAIDLHSVSYRYPQSDKVALSEMSYSFPTGPTAIVGPNGAGKSTLVKLLTGLLEPTSGTIRVRVPGGRSLPPAQTHRAVLFQEPSHLYLTIRQNITMRSERTPTEDARIHEALEIAGLGRVVDGLPDGIDTLVGAGFGGRLDLSGGQWQRLALARLIYQNAPVMILDEPVASLDPEGERAVFELFAQLKQDKVILFTTHRYDSIPSDTKIVVLVDGCIAEAGTHEELLERQRHYWSLYTAGGPMPRKSPAAEAVRTRTDERITQSAKFSARRWKLPPSPPADQERCRSRPRRLNGRLVHLQEPAAAAPPHNRSEDGGSPSGYRSRDLQQPDAGHHSAAGPAQDNLYPRIVDLERRIADLDRRVADLDRRVAEPAARPSEVAQTSAPDGNHRIDMPDPLDLRGMQERAGRDGWSSSHVEHGSAVRVSARQARVEERPIILGGEHVR